MNIVPFEKPETDKKYTILIETVEGFEYIYEGSGGVSYDNEDGAIWILGGQGQTIMFNLQSVVMLCITEEDDNGTEH